MISSTLILGPRLRAGLCRPALAAVTGAVLLATTAGCGSGGADAGSTSTATPSAGASTSTSPSASPSAAPTPEVVDGSITATDQSFTMAVPDGWTSATYGVPQPFVVAVKDAKKPPVEQILVSSFDGEATAAETAERTAAGIAAQTAQKITCDPTVIQGRSAVDCHYTYQGKPVRKMLFPFSHDGSSALMLFQTVARTRALAYTQVEPFLSSWRWADGSRLVKG